MTKAKTATHEGQDTVQASTEGQDTVQASTEGQDTVQASTEGQDTVQASTEGQDTVVGDPGATDQPGADIQATNDPAPPEAPKLNLPALTHCARQIDMLNTGGHRLQLVDELKQLYGAEIREDQDAGTFTVTCEGVTHDPALSLEEALHQWAGAARRAILEATA